MAIAGDLRFNPLTDTLTNADGKEVKLDPPVGVELPPNGFDVEDMGYIKPPRSAKNVKVKVNAKSNRIQLLTPFVPITSKQLEGMRILIKAKGKCTTDHISMAGPWLKFRGHLENISNNCYIGAINAFNDSANNVLNAETGEYGAVPDLGLYYRDNGIGSVVFGEENLGEGSSREHAAMEPRFLGVHAVIVKSFARIHETNLKKQGMLGLTFATESDYDLIQEDDTFNFVDLNAFTPGKPLTIEAVHADGSKDTIIANHTYNDSQIEWYNEGSALNLIKKQNA